MSATSISPRGTSTSPSQVAKHTGSCKSFYLTSRVESTQLFFEYSTITNVLLFIGATFSTFKRESMLVKNSFGYVQQQRPNQNSTSFFPLPVMRLALVAVAVVPIVTAHTDDSVHAHQVFAASSPSNAVASTASKVTFPSRSFQLTPPPFPSIVSMEMPLVPPLMTLLALPLLVCSLPIFRMLHSY